MYSTSNDISAKNKKDLGRVIINSSKNGSNQVLVIPGSALVFKRRSRSATPSARWRCNLQESGPGRYVLNGSGLGRVVCVLKPKTRQIMGFDRLICHLISTIGHLDGL